MLQIRSMLTAGALALLIPLGAEGQAGQAYIKLSGVPKALELPVRRGTNVVLTAEVHGGVPKVVWLARERDDASRIMLSRVDEATFQINLSDPAVQGLLAAESKGGKFQIFAEMEGGQVIATIPVYYAVAARRFPEPEVVIVTGKKSERLPTWSRYRRWLAPGKLSRIELTHHDTPPAAALARLGEREFTFSRAKGRLVLKLTPAIRKAWQKQTMMEVLFSHASGARPDRKAATLLCVPDRLDLPGNAARLVVEQRRSQVVPGSHEYLWVRIGDITAGQVRLTLATGSDEKLIERMSVTQGDVLQFKLGAEGYHLAVDRLVNLLTGTDYCEMAVFRMKPDEYTRIARAIRALEASGVKLLAGDRELVAKQGAAHLRNEFDQGPRVDTFEQFLTRIAKGFRIKRADGKVVPAAGWLKHPPEVAK